MVDRESIRIIMVTGNTSLDKNMNTLHGLEVKVHVLGSIAVATEIYPHSWAYLKPWEVNAMHERHN